MSPPLFLERKIVGSKIFVVNSHPSFSSGFLFPKHLYLRLGWLLIFSASIPVAPLWLAIFIHHLRPLLFMLSDGPFVAVSCTGLPSISKGLTTAKKGISIYLPTFALLLSIIILSLPISYPSRFFAAANSLAVKCPRNKSTNLAKSDWTFLALINML